MTEKTANVITQLKQVCKERDLSPTEVLEIIESNSDFGVISLSTIRRILKEGSENEGFRYSSIRPMVRALLGIQEDEKRTEEPEEFSVEKAREYFAEREALRQVVLLKAAEEERLREHIRKIEEHEAAELGRQSILHDQNIDRLLSLHKGHDACQEKTISILEQNNAFLQQTVAQLQEALTSERESKKRMYDDLKIYMQKLQELTQTVSELKKFHE